jgi:hypothetical protein
VMAPPRAAIVAIALISLAIIASWIMVFYHVNAPGEEGAAAAGELAGGPRPRRFAPTVVDEEVGDREPLPAAGAVGRRRRHGGEGEAAARGAAAAAAAEEEEEEEGRAAGARRRPRHGGDAAAAAGCPECNCDAAVADAVAGVAVDGAAAATVAPRIAIVTSYTRNVQEQYQPATNSKACYALRHGYHFLLEINEDLAVINPWCVSSHSRVCVCVQ